MSDLSATRRVSCVDCVSISLFSETRDEMIGNQYARLIRRKAGAEDLLKGTVWDWARACSWGILRRGPRLLGLVKDIRSQVMQPKPIDRSSAWKECLENELVDCVFPGEGMKGMFPMKWKHSALLGPLRA